MRNLLVITILLVLKYSIAQVPHPTKEQYDYLHSKQMINSYQGVVNHIYSNNPLSGYAYGESMGYMLESYLNMYETTGDKAYLIKFINETLRIMAWRNTTYRFSLVGSGNVYMDGLLLWPMAHFANLVLYQHSYLQSVVIPSNLVNIQTSTFSPNILPSQSVYTYGYIAHWLIQKQVETIDAVNTYHWIGNTKGYKKESDDNFPMEINMQAGFGGALLYLGQLSSNVSAYSGLNSYLTKGAALARLYKSNIYLPDKCNCIPQPYIYNEPLLRLESNNSYWWYHRGWRIVKRDCENFCFPYFHFNQPNYPEYVQFVEDISCLVSLRCCSKLSLLYEA
jgi:hypothetical protein